MAKNYSNPIQLPLAIDGETVEIPLTRGYVAVIDAIDGDLAQYKWFAHDARGVTYVHRQLRVASNKQQAIVMHIVIAKRMFGGELRKGIEVDHINGNGVDNRRKNLRLVTHTQNMQNQKRRRDNSSGVTGVHWNKNNEKWRARITVNGVRIVLGSFADFDDAVRARQEAERTYFGEYAATVNRG